MRGLQEKVAALEERATDQHPEPSLLPEEAVSQPELVSEPVDAAPDATLIEVHIRIIRASTVPVRLNH